MIIFNIFARNYFLSNVVNCAQFFFRTYFFLSFYKHVQPAIAKLQYFLDSLHNIIDFYSGNYDNHIVLGDFNVDPSRTQLSAFMEHYNYYNLYLQ